MPILIQDPKIQTFIFMIILLVVFLLTIRKSSNNDFFSLSVSNELKGIAILGVLFAHIWYLLAEPSQSFLFPLSIYAWVAVNLFLFLSWFWATKDQQKNDFSIIQFYKKRLVRLFPPFWLALIFILLLDFFVLHKNYPIKELLYSFIGFFPQADPWININSPFWYFTLILFYYFIFPIVFSKKDITLSAILILSISYFLVYTEYYFGFKLPIKEDVLNLYRVHILAFPLGMIFAYITSWWIENKLVNYFQKIKNYSYIIHLIIVWVLIYFIYYTGLYSGVWKWIPLEQYYALITMLLIVIAFIFKRFDIKLFTVFGLYSYEIYLLHWPIMARYEIIFKYLPWAYATAAYLVLLILIGWLFQKVSKFISAKLFN